MARQAEHRWVEDRKGLDELREVLETGQSLALDSESNSGFVYEEKLCLLQLNHGQDVWLVDLLTLPGGERALEPLRRILEDPKYVVLAHGGEFDVGCLKRDYGIALAGIWDSQQAASFLGWERTGYGAVVERICDVHLPKAHTRHDWGQRPIAGGELQYAINDVLYLPRIAAELRLEVQEADLEEEVSIACGAVEQATWNGGYKPSSLWAIKGVRRLSEEALPVLMALYSWRDSLARELDLPAGRALNNEVLVALARNTPTCLEELKRLGVPKRVTGRWAAELLDVIGEARRTPPDLPPQPAKKAFDRQIQRRGDRLKKWRREEAERRQVPMQVVLPLTALKHLQYHGSEQLESVPQLGDKRIRLYGETLRRLDATQP